MSGFNKCHPVALTAALLAVRHPLEPQAAALLASKLHRLSQQADHGHQWLKAVEKCSLECQPFHAFVELRGTALVLDLGKGASHAVL